MSSGYAGWNSRGQEPRGSEIVVTNLHDRRAKDGIDRIEKRGSKIRASVGWNWEVWTVIEVVRSLKKTDKECEGRVSVCVYVCVCVRVCREMETESLGA